jgi:TPR repeat protein
LTAAPTPRRPPRWLLWGVGWLAFAAVALVVAWASARDARVPGTLRDRLHLGGSLADGRNPRKDRVGLWLHDLLCRAGDPRGCTNVGRIYKAGRGVPVDPARAVTLFAEACAKGDGLGCSDLGLQYAWGVGVTQDAARAASLYRDACRLRDEAGCYDLGYCYEHGFGVTVDLPAAVQLYAASCEGGEGRGCLALGELVESGSADASDLDAAEQFARACKLGEQAGCASNDRLGIGR